MFYLSFLRVQNSMWARSCSDGTVSVYCCSSSGSGRNSLVKAAVGTAAICATVTSAFLSPPSPITRTSANGCRRAPCLASVDPRARATPTTTAATVVFGSALTDQQIDSYSFRDIIGDNLLAVEDAEKSVTREVCMHVRMQLRLGFTWYHGCLSCILHLESVPFTEKCVVGSIEGMRVYVVLTDCCSFRKLACFRTVH